MLKCKCGGEYKSIDSLFDCGLRNHGVIVYDVKRIKKGYATRRCDKCGRRRYQKLRVSKSPEIKELRPLKFGF